MRWKERLAAVFVCILLLGLSIETKAAPYFSNASLYTEHNLTFRDTWSYQFGVFVYDDSYDIQSVTAREVTSNQVFILSDHVTLTGEGKWGSAAIDGMPFIDQLEITAINTNGESSSVLTHVLDKDVAFGFATNITVSDTSITPTFTWDTVAGAESYRVRILNSSGSRIFDSIQHVRILSTSYTIPDGVLTIGKSYTARIIANDHDLENDILELENRSSNYLDFQTLSAPLPEPTAMLLFHASMLSAISAKLKMEKK